MDLSSAVFGSQRLSAMRWKAAPLRKGILSESHDSDSRIPQLVRAPTAQQLDSQKLIPVFSDTPAGHFPRANTYGKSVFPQAGDVRKIKWPFESRVCVAASSKKLWLLRG